MSGALDLAASNLLSPMVLFFALGIAAAAARSDLEIPQAVAKAMALYLMLAIGFKGGVGVSEHGLDLGALAGLVAAVALSFLIPLIAYWCIRLNGALPRVDAAAVAAHYGSISIVTFAVAVDQLTGLDIGYEGYLVAAAAAMEAPAIVSGLLLAQRHGQAKHDRGGSATGLNPPGSGALMREVAFNGAIVVLLGAFLIGWLTGRDGLDDISPLIVDPFKGVLCLFLLDMGLVAGRGLRKGLGDLRLPMLSFGLYMPLIGGALGAATAWLLGLSAGGAALLITLAASASYIAVPAAMRLALPEARPSIYLTLSLGITFPFNLAIGIPLYIGVAQWLTAPSF